LGAAMIMIAGFTSSWFGMFLLPVVGTIFGLASVTIAVAFAHQIDKSLSNNTIVLSGMVVSLFLNAIMSTLATANPKYTHKILLWQLGSFSGKEWSAIGVLTVVIVIC